jgi:hypothetical protein
MYFIRNGIVDSLMKQYKIFYIKYYLFHDVIAIIKYTIFKLKTIIYIYITSIWKVFF